MKNLLVIPFIALMCLFAANTATAQCAKSVTKACCASKSASVSTEDSKALLVAMEEQGVEKHVCEKSGKVSYFIKEASADNNTEEIAMQEVSFDASLGKFINVAPKKACCAKGSAEKEACKGKEAASGKACCKAKSTR